MQFLKTILPSESFAVDTLESAGELRFEFIRVQSMSFAKLRSLRSLNFLHCDLGGIAFPVLQNLGSRM